MTANVDGIICLLAAAGGGAMAWAH